MSEPTEKRITRRDFLKIAGLAISGIATGFQAPRDLERERLIQKFGPATRIPALEFHGDNYYFFGGAYCMNPPTFKYLMTWFQDNEVWSPTSDEVVGYLQGTMDLPSRSVILTTDSGNVSKPSLLRMIPVLEETGQHFISLIWTRFMLGTESILCQDDVCWSTFREAKESGVFSFGSHTESHADFALFTPEEGMADLLQSKNEIEENLGVSPQLISWPFESVPSWAPMLSELGYVAAFAGNNHRPTMIDNAVRPKDSSPWDLPRVLPPNTGSLTSGRPDGKTIQEIMEMFTSGFGERAFIYQIKYDNSIQNRKASENTKFLR